MSEILVVHCSPHGSLALADEIVREAVTNLRRSTPRRRVVERNLAEAALPTLDREYAAAVIAGEPDSAPVFARSETLIRELEDCDYLVIATPVHNFTVPAALKLWIDYVVRAGRTFRTEAGKKSGLLADRPTLVVVSSGGFFTGDSARQPDFLSPYLLHVLQTIGIKDVRFICLQGTVRTDLVPTVVERGREQLAADHVFGPEALAS